MENNKEKKSLHVVFLDFDDIRNSLLGAGQAKATLEVGKRLAKKGYRVTVISSRFPGYRDREEEGLVYRHIGLGSRNIRLNNIFYILSIPLVVLRLKADIIIECFTAPISTLFTPLFTKIPVAALATSFEAERFSRKYHLPFWAVEKSGCRFYKYFLPPTPHSEAKMKRLNPSVFSKIVPEGVGEEFFKITKKRGEHILFLGRLDIDQKGIDLLIKAYAKIKNKIAWPLIIAGSGPDEEKVKFLIKESGAADKIFLYGPAYGNEKMELMSRSLFVALPSRHEGFSIFALEALAAGLVPVAFAISGLSWLPEKVSLKAKQFDTDEYSLLLEKAATDTNLIGAMGAAARIFSKQFSWDNAARQIEDFLKEILIKEKNRIR